MEDFHSRKKKNSLRLCRLLAMLNGEGLDCLFSFLVRIDSSLLLFCSLKWMGNVSYLSTHNARLSLPTICSCVQRTDLFFFFFPPLFPHFRVLGGQDYLFRPI